MTNLEVFKKALLTWPRVMKYLWSWLSFCLVIELLCMVAANTLKSVDERYFLLGLAWSFVIQLILSALSVIVVNQLAYNFTHSNAPSVGKAIKENIKYVLIESTRALVPIILWGLLLVIPGIIETCRLYWVPYLAQFDEDYKAGKLDALERSRELCRGRVLKVMGILILTMVLSIVPRFWLDALSLGKSPYLFMLAFFASIALELYSDLTLFFYYEKLNWGVKNGHSISLPRPSKS